MKKHLGKIGFTIMAACFALGGAVFWEPAMFPSWTKLAAMAGMFAGLVVMFVAEFRR